jgi:hypothetical protein
MPLTWVPTTSAGMAATSQQAKATIERRERPVAIDMSKKKPVSTRTPPRTAKRRRTATAGADRSP